MKKEEILDIIIEKYSKSDNYSYSSESVSEVFWKRDFQWLHYFKDDIENTSINLIESLTETTYDYKILIQNKASKLFLDLYVKDKDFQNYFRKNKIDYLLND